MKHTVIISDVHLCEGVPGDDLWMRWRQHPFFPDVEFESLVSAVLAAVDEGDRIEFVFNGDLFDFDAGRVINGEARFEDLPRTEPVSADLIDRILTDHPGYVRGCGRLLAGGHSLVFVAGNHDPQVGFEAVRARIRHRLAAAAGIPAATGRVHFRQWFHHSDNGIHIEHGNQYDPYCSFRYPMAPHLPPVRGADREIHATVGSIAFRWLGARLGYMNPHVDSSWELTLPQYLRHWVEHYMFTRHSLANTWFRGSWEVVAQTWRGRRDRGSPDREARDLEAAARETGCDLELVRAHAALFAKPADENFHRVVREFWIDRMLLGTACAAAVTVPMFVRNRRAVSIAVGLPALFVAYELAVPAPSMEANYERIAARATEIAEIYRARAVIFGHTHVPYGRWEDGVFFGNSGTWSAAFRDMACTEPVDARGKPVIWLRDRGNALEGGLYRWDGARMLPDEERRTPSLTPPVPSSRATRSPPRPEST
jgi:UDP-2,3-diacylglucosamine pyrophosphatase LpxH